MKTVNGIVDYEVKVYGYIFPDPATADISGTGSLFNLANVDLISSALGASQNGGQPVKASGITSISLNRSKDTPASACQIAIQGPLSENLKMGAWVVVFSVLRSNNTKSSLPKFLGQICSIDTIYSTNPTTGLVSESHEITVREWSAALQTQVRFNAVSFMKFFDPNSAAGAIDLLGTPAGSIEVQKLIADMAKTYNPYEFGELVLSIVGAMNEIDKSPNIKGLDVVGADGKPFPQVASGLPIIPKELLDDLGISTTNSLGIGSQSGFSGVSVIGGVLTDPFKNDGTWSGFMKEEEFEEYKKAHKKNLPHIPASTQVSSLIQTGYFSAWGLLANACEPSLNETYTDMLFVEKEGKIVARPTIFLRAKPFLSTHAFQLASKVYKTKQENTYSFYDHLPRYNLESALIQDLRVNSTILDSPNNIQTNITNLLTNPEFAQAAALAAGLVYNKGFQDRFGGIPMYPDLTYTSIDQAGNIMAYSIDLSALNTGWYAFNYRTPSATMTLKSPQVPLSIGTNIQFSFKKYILVAHIDAISERAIVTPEGILMTNLSVRLSRLMKLVDNELLMLDLGEAERLLR